MGASVNAYWPGITEEQRESQPGFYNDDKAWGNFMAERESEPQVLETIERLNAGALLTYTSDGIEDDWVDWVTPNDLREAARNLREAVQANHPETKIILNNYERNANGIDSVADELVQDLNDIEAIANWAEAEGTELLTLEVNW